MKVVFYSTNSNVFDKETFKISVLPSNETQFNTFIKKHPEHEFICISQLPAMFMPEKSTIILPQDSDYKQMAEKIIEQSPDVAIALTYYVNPYDWLTVNDALVAEILNQHGIKTICNSVNTGLICFDKYRTHQHLLQNNFNVPSALFVDHDLYFCAGSHKEVIQNVYKQSVASQINKMTLPLIIKDTVGLSSYGMTVVHTYGEAIGYLNSKRNNSNRIVEEYIQGEHFGTEIYGVPGQYSVLPLFKFSLNQYGITSPKQSSKEGPYKLPLELETELLRLAQSLQIQGCAQVDLIHSDDGKWYIIEINPRLSGMSYLYASVFGLTVFDLIWERAKNNNENVFNVNLSNKHFISQKIDIQTELQMQNIIKQDGVLLLNQSNDMAAKQEREKGFCEIIIEKKCHPECKKMSSRM